MSFQMQMHIQDLQLRVKELEEEIAQLRDKIRGGVDGVQAKKQRRTGSKNKQ